MLLLSVSTKKRKHNWEITKRDLTKLTSPSVRTKNDWSRRASGQKIGYLNSRTLRSVRLFFFSPSPGVLGRSHPRGFPALTLPMLTALEKHERSPLKIFRNRSHKRARPCAISCISTAAIRASASRPSFRSFDTALPSAPCLPPSAHPKWTPTVPPPAHKKTRHSPRGRVSRRDGVECCRHATASPHRQFSTERACCSNRARSRSCAHRASACCRERVRGTCGGRTHRASQRRPCG